MPCVQESPHGSIPLFLLPVSVGRCCSCKNIPQCVYSRPLLRKKCEANTLRWTFILPATQFRWTSIRWHPKHVISGISVATFENYSKLQRIWNLHPNSSNSPPPFCQQNRQKNMKIHISPLPPVFFWVIRQFQFCPSLLLIPLREQMRSLKISKQQCFYLWEYLLKIH